MIECCAICLGRDRLKLDLLDFDLLQWGFSTIALLQLGLQKRLSPTRLLTGEHSHHVAHIIEFDQILLLKWWKQDGQDKWVNKIVTYRIRLVLKGGSKRCYQHVINLLALFFLFKDVRDSIFQLHDVLLVQGLHFVKLTHGLSELELEGIDLFWLILLLLDQHWVVGHLVIFLGYHVGERCDVRRTDIGVLWLRALPTKTQYAIFGTWSVHWFLNR